MKKMKKISLMIRVKPVMPAVIFILCLLLGLAPVYGESDPPAQAGPVIALTHIPVYGDQQNKTVSGVVFREDGGSFETDSYRLALYLQINPGESYYVKPYDNQTATAITGDGSFSVQFNTGGADYNARLLYVMLIPAGFTPDGNYERTRAAALDCVTVTRSENGVNSVEPSREAPYVGVPALPSGLSVSSGRIALDVGFHTDGSSPGSALSKSLIRQHLNAIRPYCNGVRFYSSSDEVSPAYAIARGMGFTVLGSAWLSKDKAANRREMDALIEHCNKGECSAAIVGSETLLRGDLSPAELIAAIRYVRKGLNDDTIPVTTADSFHMLAAHPDVCNACSFILANCYPYWNGASIDEAEANFTGSIAALNAVKNGKEIVVSETGWPTGGGSKGNAVAGEAEAARYYGMVRSWSLRTGVSVLYFSSADEPWKVRDEGAVGAAWGIFSRDLTLKDCYSVCNPFGTGGVYGESLFWRVENGVLTLWLPESAESSAMPGLPEGGSGEDYPWAAYAAETESIVIEDGLESVAPFAFSGADYASVSALTLPASVTEIGEYAFSGCAGLSAVIPGTVTEIGENAFADTADVRFCFPAADCILPAKTTEIGDSAFEGTQAVSVRLPDGCTSIGARAFAACGSLRRIRIPASVDTIGEDAFADCGTLYVYGEAASAAEDYCADPAHENLRFLLLQPEER